MQQLIDLNWGVTINGIQLRPTEHTFMLKLAVQPFHLRCSFQCQNIHVKLPHSHVLIYSPFCLNDQPTKTVYGSRSWKNYASGLKQLEVNQTQCIICFQSLT